MASPKSPRHYDKYSYAAKRKLEKESEEVPQVFPSPRRNLGLGPVASRTATCSLVPLFPSAEGFAIAEDGSVSSRFVSPPRFSPAPIAMVSMPVSVDSTQIGPGRGTIAYVSTPCQEQTVLKPKERETWQKLIQMAAIDFNEEEIEELSWDVIADLLRHYNVFSAVEIARIQIEWKRRQLNRSSQQGSGEQGSVLFLPSTFITANRSVGTFKSDCDLGNRPQSPRRQGRFVPDHKKPLQWNASAKIDSGRGRK